MSLAIADKVVADKVVIAMIDDAIHERGEGASVAEGVLLDGVENFGKGGLELILAVDVGVAELVDVFGEVAKEEDVVLADFAGDFNLSSVSLVDQLSVLPHSHSLRHMYQ